MFAPHRKTLSSNRISTLDEYKRFLEQCSQDAKKSSKQQLVQKLYFTSKDLFKQQAEHLNPKEKGTILKLYIEFWKTHDCQMSLSEANYGANEDDSYYSKWPMTAGFNLSRAELAIEFSDLYFLKVNFNHADFSEAHFVYARFEQCSFSSIKTSPKTNLCEAKFSHCQLNSVDFSKQYQISLEYCNYRNSHFAPHTWLFKCTEPKSRYPSKPSPQIKKTTPQLAPVVQNNLIEFFLSQLNEDSSFTEIRAIAKAAINHGMVKDAANKREWILSSIEHLRSLKNSSLSLQTIILSAIEVVVLSKRISNSRALGIFAKEVDGNKNHCWRLDGARLALSTYYPDLNLAYCLCSEQDTELGEWLSLLSQHKSLWLVAGYSFNYHLTLVKLELDGHSLKIQIFDSLGTTAGEKTTPYDSSLFDLFTKLKQSLGVRSCIVESVKQQRQKDSSNCFAFVLADLKAALELSSTEEAVFLDGAAEQKHGDLVLKQYQQFDKSFYTTTQSKRAAPKELLANFTTPLSQKRPQNLSNPTALLMSAATLSTLFSEKKITTTPIVNQSEEDSEEDINECSIM